MFGKMRIVTHTHIYARLWKYIFGLYPTYLRLRYGMNIGENTVISRKANLDRIINPKGIHIGRNTWILANVCVLTHDHFRNLITNTYIGENCFIGIRAIIMPGVRIGNEVAIGAGSVVTKDIPSNCIAAGNPARVIKENIRIKDGRILSE